MHRLWCEQEGRWITLGPPLGGGGEADVYEVSGDPGLVAKIFKQPDAEREAKLHIMVADPPMDPMQGQGHHSFTWPIDLLYSPDKGQFHGYLMPRIKGASPIFDLYNPQTRRSKYPLFSWRYLLRTARNLASTVAAIHKRGYVIGDINESNVYVTDTALVTLIDTDSFQVTDVKSGKVFRCPVGKPEFTPPELQEVHSFRDIDRAYEHDLFGMAVLIFLLLMEGTYPFAGTGDPSNLGERILKGYFPYDSKRSKSYSPPTLAPPFNILYPELQKLFIRCFVDGHGNPKARPTAREWDHALEEAEQVLTKCRRNKQHLYSGHLSACPWCERAKLLGGRDPFPSRKAVQRGQHLQQPLPSVGKRRTIPVGTPATTRTPSKSPAATVTPPITHPRRISSQVKRVMNRALTLILVMIIIAFIGHFLRLSIIDVFNFDILNWRSSAPTTSPSRFITSPAPPSPPSGALPGKIAFASNREGRYWRSDLYVMNADGSNVRQLTFVNHIDWVTNELGIDIDLDNLDRDQIEYFLTASNVLWGAVPFIGQPSWSPDGQKVAFIVESSSNQDGVIYIMDADGTNVRRLLPEAVCTGHLRSGYGCRDPAWSPDGKRIAFAMPMRRAYPYYDWVWRIYIIDADVAPELKFQWVSKRIQGVYVVDIDGAGIRKLTEPKDGPVVHDRRPVWSPDGSKIAFIRVYGEEDEQGFHHRVTSSAVYVINADGGHERRLMECNACVALAWSPDGARIAFGSSDRNGRWDIYIVDIDGGNVVNLTERWTHQRPQWLPQQAFIAGLTWSPDGNWISFKLGKDRILDEDYFPLGVINRRTWSWKDHPGLRVIWVISADGAKLYSVTYSHHLNQGKEFWDHDPTWSPVLP